MLYACLSYACPMDYYFIILLCKLHMQSLYTGGGGFTQLQTNTLSLVANQVFKSVNRSYFCDIARQVVPDVTSVRPKGELISISDSL